MSTYIVCVLLVVGPLAQIPGGDDVWKVAAQSGFNAVLVLLLLWLGARERERNRVSIDLLTKAVTDVVLAMSFLPKQFHDHAKEIQRGVEENEK